MMMKQSLNNNNNKILCFFFTIHMVHITYMLSTRRRNTPLRQQLPTYLLPSCYCSEPIKIICRGNSENFSLLRLCECVSFKLESMYTQMYLLNLSLYSNENLKLLRFTTKNPFNINQKPHTNVNKHNKILPWTQWIQRLIPCILYSICFRR